MCFQEEMYTVLENDGSITICVEYSGTFEISDPIAVFIKTEDISAEGMLSEPAVSAPCNYSSSSSCLGIHAEVFPGYKIKGKDIRILSPRYDLDDHDVK